MSVVLQSSPSMGSYTTHGDATTTGVRVNPSRNTSGTNIDVANTTMNCCGELA